MIIISFHSFIHWMIDWLIVSFIYSSKNRFRWRIVKMSAMTPDNVKRKDGIRVTGRKMFVIRRGSFGFVQSIYHWIWCNLRILLFRCCWNVHAVEKHASWSCCTYAGEASIASRSRSGITGALHHGVGLRSQLRKNHSHHRQYRLSRTCFRTEIAVAKPQKMGKREGEMFDPLRDVWILFTCLLGFSKDFTKLMKPGNNINVKWIAAS